MSKSNPKSSSLKPQKLGIFIKSELKTQKSITSLSKTIDNFLNGGLNKGIITEFAGQSGSGKTQFALHFAVAAQISDEIKNKKIVKKVIKTQETNINDEMTNDTCNNEKNAAKNLNFEYKQTKVCYICGPATAKNLLIKRTEEFCSRFVVSLKRQNKVMAKLSKLISSDNILWKDCQNFEQFSNLLTTLKQLDSFIPENNVKLLIIDSIGGFFRGREEDELLKEADYKNKIGYLLTNLAEKYVISVLVLNQVGAVIEDENKSSFTSFSRSHPELLPLERYYLKYHAVLGLTWSRWVKSRYYITVDRSSLKYKRDIIQAFSFSGPILSEKFENGNGKNDKTLLASSIVNFSYKVSPSRILKLSFSVGQTGVSSSGEIEVLEI